MTLLSTTTLTTTTTAITGISQDFVNLMIVIAGISIPTPQRIEIAFRNGASGQNLYVTGTRIAALSNRNGGSPTDVYEQNMAATDTRNIIVAKLDLYSDSTRRKGAQIYGAMNQGGQYINLAGSCDDNVVINAFFIDVNAVPTAGTVQIWGIK